MSDADELDPEWGGSVLALQEKVSERSDKGGDIRPLAERIASLAGEVRQGLVQALIEGQAFPPERRRRRAGEILDLARRLTGLLDITLARLMEHPRRAARNGGAENQSFLYAAYAKLKEHGEALTVLRALARAVLSGPEDALPHFLLTREVISAGSEGALTKEDFVRIFPPEEPAAGRGRMPRSVLPVLLIALATAISWVAYTTAGLPWILAAALVITAALLASSFQLIRETATLFPGRVTRFLETFRAYVADEEPSANCPTTPATRR